MEHIKAALPQPQITSVNQTYWDSLKAGDLMFQQCACGHRWLPARTECPSCLARDWQWKKATGDARLVTWVVYHHAYHPSVADRLPYTVAVVELAEGPRLVTNIVEQDHPEPLRVDMPLALRIEVEGDTSLPRFAVRPPGEAETMAPH